MAAVLSSLSSRSQERLIVDEQTTFDTGIPLYKYFKNALEAVNYIVNSPLRDRATILDFTALPVNSEMFRRILARCPNLVKLNVTYGDLEKINFETCFTNVPLLKELNLSYCLHRVQSVVFKNLPNLEILNVAFMGQYAVFYIFPDVTHIPNLTSITVGGVTHVSKRALTTLNKVQNLASITLIGFEYYYLEPTHHLYDLQQRMLAQKDNIQVFDTDELPFVHNPTLKNVTVQKDHQV